MSHLEKILESQDEDRVRSKRECEPVEIERVKPMFRTVTVIVPYDDKDALILGTERALGYLKDGAESVRIIEGIPGKREEVVAWPGATGPSKA